MCTFKAVTQIYIEKRMWEKLIINLIFSPRLKKKTTKKKPFESKGKTGNTCFLLLANLKKNNYFKYFVGLSNDCEIEISKISICFEINVKWPI